jgi:hypothetical protein
MMAVVIASSVPHHHRSFPRGSHGDGGMPWSDRTESFLAGNLSFNGQL